MNPNTPAPAGKVERSSGRRYRWAPTLLVVATTLVSSLLGASSASAAPNPTITIEYDATAVDVHGVVQPSVIFRGNGFLPRPRDHSDIVLSVRNETASATTSTYRFGHFAVDTMGRITCTVTTPKLCFIGYQPGELRPTRLFLGDSSPGRGRNPECGDLFTASALDASTGTGVPSNRITFRIPCETYTLRPPISVHP